MSQGYTRYTRDILYNAGLRQLVAGVGGREHFVNRPDLQLAFSFVSFATNTSVETLTLCWLTCSGLKSEEDLTRSPAVKLQRPLPRSRGPSGQSRRRKRSIEQPQPQPQPALFGQTRWQFNRRISLFVRGISAPTCKQRRHYLGAGVATQPKRGRGRGRSREGLERVLPLFTLSVYPGTVANTLLQIAATYAQRRAPKELRKGLSASLSTSQSLSGTPCAGFTNLAQCVLI